MELQTPPPDPLTGGFWLSESTNPWFYPPFQDYPPWLQKCQKSTLCHISQCVNIGSEVLFFFLNYRLSSLKKNPRGL